MTQSKLLKSVRKITALLSMPFFLSIGYVLHESILSGIALYLSFAIPNIVFAILLGDRTRKNRYE